MDRWTRALSEENAFHEVMRRYDDYWEYKEAIADLRANTSLFCQDYADIPTRPHPHFILSLWPELSAYGYHLNRITETNDALRAMCRVMRQAHTSFAGVTAKSTFKMSAELFVENVEELRLEVVEFAKDYWDKVFALGQFTSECSDDDFGARFHLFTMRPLSHTLKLPEIRQERNLDTTFQVRVGDLLRKYVPNPYGCRLSLITISRLVLLVYICAGLADEVEGNLTIWASNPARHLSVDRTYETLRDAGLK